MLRVYGCRTRRIGDDSLDGWSICRADRGASGAPTTRCTGRRSTVRPARGRPPCTTFWRFLAAAGLDGVPRVLGFDDEGREVLTYLPGRTDRRRRRAGARRRRSPRCRDAGCAGSTTPSAAYDPGPRTWRQTAVVARAGAAHLPQRHRRVQLDRRRRPLRRHDRLGSGRPRSSARRPRVPLLERRPALPRDCRRRMPRAACGSPPTRMAASSRPTLLDAVADRMQRASDRIAAGIERGDPGMLSLRRSGSPSAHGAA